MREEDRFTREDLRRNEDPQPVSGAVGGAVGAGVGGAVGATLGPLGVVIGVLAGAAGGWWSGREFHSSLAGADRADNVFRRAHEHAGATRPYEEVRHGYRLGYLAGRNPDLADRDFDAVERDLRTAWVKAHETEPQPVSWDDVRPAAQQGFDYARAEDHDREGR